MIVQIIDSKYAPEMEHRTVATIEAIEAVFRSSGVFIVLTDSQIESLKTQVVSHTIRSSSP